MSTHDDDDLRIKTTLPDDSGEPDTEGHNMQLYDLARTVQADRSRNAAEANTQARMRDKSDQPKKGIRGFLRRG